MCCLPIRIIVSLDVEGIEEHMKVKCSEIAHIVLTALVVHLPLLLPDLPLPPANLRAGPMRHDFQRHNPVSAHLSGLRKPPEYNEGLVSNPISATR